MKTSQLALTSAILMALAACGSGQSDGTAGDAGNTSTKDTPTAATETTQATEAASDGTASTTPDLAQYLAARLNTAVPLNISSDTPPVSSQGVRGDVVLAALTQLDQTGSSAAPLEIPVSAVEARGVDIIRNFNLPLNYHSTLHRGSDAGVDTDFGRVSRSYVVPNDDGKTWDITPLTLRYGFHFVQNRIDRRNGDMISIGKTLKATVRDDNPSADAENLELTADREARLNWQKVYHTSSPVQTWESDEKWFRFKVSLVASPESDGKSFRLCELFHGAGKSEADVYDIPRREVCTHWAVPDNWQPHQKLKRISSNANEVRLLLRWFDYSTPLVYDAYIYWSDDGASAAAQ